MAGAKKEWSAHGCYVPCLGCVMVDVFTCLRRSKGKDGQLLDDMSMFGVYHSRGEGIIMFELGMSCLHPGCVTVGERKITRSYFIRCSCSRFISVTARKKIVSTLKSCPGCGMVRVGIIHHRACVMVRVAKNHPGCVMVNQK